MKLVTYLTQPHPVFIAAFQARGYGAYMRGDVNSPFHMSTMADVSNEHTHKQCQKLMGVTNSDKWKVTQDAAYKIGAKVELISTVNTPLTNKQKIVLFDALSKVSGHPYHYQRTNPDAVRRVHGSNPRARQEHRPEHR